jgi:hypothetical protein
VSRYARRLALLALATLALLSLCERPSPLVLGTFNIENFPDVFTDRDGVAAALAALDADAFAVQEIGDVAAFGSVLADAGARTGRRWAAVFTPYCRARSDLRMNIGIVYDRDRLELRTLRPLTAGETCPKGQVPGLAAAFESADGRRLALASVHLTALDHDRAHEARRAEWSWLAAELPGLTAELGAPVILAGDFNSTGWLDPTSTEHRFITALLADRALQLPTGHLGCSAYWNQRAAARWDISLLDHFVAPAGLSFKAAESLGMCAELACAPQDGPPSDWTRVSDHCPVRVVLE